MPLLRSLGLALVAMAGLAAAPASASVILSFVQDNGAPDGGLRFGGTIAVSDAAYAKGLYLDFSPAGTGPSLADQGVEAIDLQFLGGGVSAIITAQSLAGGTAFPQLSAGGGAPFGGGGFLASGPGQQPTGYLGATETGYYSLDILFSSGRFWASLTTAEGACAEVRCAITGVLDSSAALPPAAVPEPASLSLLAVGAAGLLASRRRRAA